MGFSPISIHHFFVISIHDFVVLFSQVTCRRSLFDPNEGRAMKAGVSSLDRWMVYGKSHL